MGMAEIALKQTQKQALQLSQSLQQSLRILQMNSQELLEFIAHEAERNPFVEFTRPAGPSHDPLEIIDKFRYTEPTLVDHLQEQIEVLFRDPQDKIITNYLVHALDDDGYLRTPNAELLADLKIPNKKLDNIIDQLQKLEPTGVFARNLADCLKIQLQEKNRYSDTYAKLLAHLDLVAANQLKQLSAICNTTTDDIIQMLHSIRELNPKPASNFSSNPPQYTTAEIIVEWQNGNLMVQLNQDAFPAVIVESELFQRMLHNMHKPEDIAFCKTNYNSAQQLRRACVQRAETILRVAKAVVEKQQAFFLHGIEHLVPLTQKDIATALELHESTISRVAKITLDTPIGYFCLKHFFSSKITSSVFENEYSSTFIKERIRKLIASETGKPLADNTIAETLKAEGIRISRRTVTKYREAMNIASSQQRKQKMVA
jgi:RNA polymerase sigma-54 factor